MKKLIAALGVLFAMSVSVLPAGALDSTQSYYGQVLDPSWLNLEPRDVKAGLGEALYNILGSNPQFSNLSVTASGGLYVSVGPSTSGQFGALYQPGPLAPFAVGGSPIGASGATQLAADSTQVMLQGLVGSPALSVGPLTAPSGSGTSISYLVECQVQEVSKTPQTQTFETLPNYTYTTATANRDLADTIACQSKASTASASPTTPSVDSGYVSIASVLVPNGTTTLSTSNITITTANQLGGVLPQRSGNAIGADGSFQVGGSYYGTKAIVPSFEAIGTYGTDDNNAINIGSGATGETVIGTTSATTPTTLLASGVGGSSLRISKCTSVGSACTGSLTLFNLDGSGNAGVTGYLSAQRMVSAGPVDVNGVNPVPGDVSSSNQNNSNEHIERSNGLITIGAGGTYAFNFISSYTSTSTFSCQLTGASYAGSAPNGAPYASTVSNSSLTILNPSTGTQNVWVLCAGY